MKCKQQLTVSLQKTIFILSKVSKNSPVHKIGRTKHKKYVWRCTKHSRKLKFDSVHEVSIKLDSQVSFFLNLIQY